MCGLTWVYSLMHRIQNEKWDLLLWNVKAQISYSFIDKLYQTSTVGRNAAERVHYIVGIQQEGSARELSSAGQACSRITAHLSEERLISIVRVRGRLIAGPERSAAPIHGKPKCRLGLVSPKK